MHPFKYPCESPNLCQVALAGRQHRSVANRGFLCKDDDLPIKVSRHVKRSQCCCRGSSTKSPMMLLLQQSSTCLTAQPAADLLPMRFCAQFTPSRAQGRRATLKVSAFESQAQPWKKSPAASSRCAAAPALLFLSPVSSAACRPGSSCRVGAFMFCGSVVSMH